MIGPVSRNGYTTLANAESERLFNALTLEQFRLYVGLRIEAQFGEPGVSKPDKFGRRFRLDVGEVLFSIDGAATRYGMSRDQAIRARDRFVQLGLVEVVKTQDRLVRAATPPATPAKGEAATGDRREAATPPSILRFVTEREKCWSDVRAATPPAPSPAPAAATPGARETAMIQPDQPRNQSTTKPKNQRSPSATAAAPPAPLAAAAAAAGDGLLAFKKIIESAIGRRVSLGKGNREVLAERIREVLERHREEGIAEICRLKEDAKPGQLQSVAGFLKMIRDDWSDDRGAEQVPPEIARARAAGDAIDPDVEHVLVVLGERFEAALGVYDLEDIDDERSAAKRLLDITEGDLFVIEERCRLAVEAGVCRNLAQLATADVWNKFPIDHGPEWNARREERRKPRGAREPYRSPFASPTR